MTATQLPKKTSEEWLCNLKRKLTDTILDLQLRAQIKGELHSQKLNHQIWCITNKCFWKDQWPLLQPSTLGCGNPVPCRQRYNHSHQKSKHQMKWHPLIICLNCLESKWWKTVLSCYESCRGTAWSPYVHGRFLNGICIQVGDIEINKYPMASCLSMDSFLLLHTAPWCIKPVESEKTQPQLLANLVVATNHTATVAQYRKQQKIARVNRYSAPTVAHQGACSSASAT